MAEPAPTRNPATPVSSAPAASQTQPQSSAAVSSSSAAASSSAPASSASSSAAASSTSASTSASSSASAAPSSSAASSSSVASSISSSPASSTTRATIASAAPSSDAESSSGLSGGAIGGIAGGAVGGLILIALLWYLIRRRKDRKHRVPPPPPRDFREMSFHGSARPRMGSNNMMSQSHRQSSYSTLIHPGRPSSQYPSASRSPSYYATYPVATPSTLPDSPPMPASLTGGESPPEETSSGLNTPAMKPVLAPIDTALLRRDNSSSSGEGPAAGGPGARGEFGVLPPKHKSSIDRLRSDVDLRAPSRTSLSSSGDRDQSSRTTSPHPSMYGPSAFPGAGARQHSLSPDGHGTPGRYPRPPSMASLSTHSQSGRYLRPQGAPHAGRIVNLEMPKPLGARPDSSGDYFWQTPKIQQQGFDLGFDGAGAGGHQRRTSRAATELDFHSMPTYGHARMPSSQSQTQSSRDKARSPSIVSPSSHDRQPAQSRSMNNMRAGAAAQR